MNTKMNDGWKKDRIASAHRGENPMVLCDRRYTISSGLLSSFAL